ncbi:MAG: hypothetical protein FJ006_00060 [Chloroflexi bacterium]|nr:hypothetical protein [Chloroflexota bacterium]
MVKTQIRHGIGDITISYPKFPFDETFNGDGGGGEICFICGKTMGEGELFTCASRLLQTCEGDKVKPKVIEAVASLQVCLPCTLLSAYDKLQWAHKPKLTKVELYSFYAYASLLAKSITWLKSDSRVQKEFMEHLIEETDYLPVELDRADLLGGIYDSVPAVITDGQCLRCSSAVNPSNPHIEFKIAIDIPGHKGMSSSNIWRLGEYCDQCSNQLLPLCSRLW